VDHKPSRGLVRDRAPPSHLLRPAPRFKSRQGAHGADLLLDQHHRDGALPTSVRFLFYELVMQRIVAKEGDRPDKIVSAALTDLRENGLVRFG
jgi:hypothetical protein